MAIVMVKSDDAVAFFSFLLLFKNLFRIISSAPIFVHHYSPFFFFLFRMIFFLFCRGTVEPFFFPLRLLLDRRFSCFIFFRKINFTNRVLQISFFPLLAPACAARVSPKTPVPDLFA